MRGRGTGQLGMGGVCTCARALYTMRTGAEVAFPGVKLSADRRILVWGLCGWSGFVVRHAHCGTEGPAPTFSTRPRGPSVGSPSPPTLAPDPGLADCRCAFAPHRWQHSPALHVVRRADQQLPGQRHRHAVSVPGEGRGSPGPSPLALKKGPSGEDPTRNFPQRTYDNRRPDLT